MVRRVGNYTSDNRAAMQGVVISMMPWGVRESAQKCFSFSRYRARAICDRGANGSSCGVMPFF